MVPTVTDDQFPIQQPEELKGTWTLLRRRAQEQWAQWIYSWQTVSWQMDEDGMSFVTEGMEGTEWLWCGPGGHYWSNHGMDREQLTGEHS